MTSLYKYTIPSSGMYLVHHHLVCNGTYHYNKGDVLEIAVEEPKGRDSTRYLLKRNGSLLSVNNIMEHDTIYNTRLYRLLGYRIDRLSIYRISQ